MKKGRFSTEDMEFIEAKAEVLSPESIAEHLDRDPDSIRDWIKKMWDSLLVRKRGCCCE